MSKPIEQLDIIREDLRQVAREIFYALSLLRTNEPAKANLIRGLEILGVSKPIDVGLSNNMANWKL